MTGGAFDEVREANLRDLIDYWRGTAYRELERNGVLVQVGNELARHVWRSPEGIAALERWGALTGQVPRFPRCGAILNEEPDARCTLPKGHEGHRI